MENTITYDFIGIGIGPFNLGLAALASPIEGLNGLFLDQAEEFNWHPGLMFDTATLQVPFMADLVTMADPTSEFSFLNYLKKNDRLYKFYIREDFYVLRKEYNAYLRWVCSRLDNLKWNSKVSEIQYLPDLELYLVSSTCTKTGEITSYFTRKLVVGTGTAPYLPEFARKADLEKTIHASQYLDKKQLFKSGETITVVGSGQSAAEVVADLLPEVKNGLKLNWLTRPDRFFPMEYYKLTLELTSPDYVDHFHALPATKRDQILKAQNPLYKGISGDLINAIHEALYEMTVDGNEVPVRLIPCAELLDINLQSNTGTELKFQHTQLEQEFTIESDWSILATGYKNPPMHFLKGIEDRIARDEKGRLDVQRNYAIDVNGGEIFVQNAELHTHGFVTPDLGMGAYRNASIINQITGAETYQVETKIAFQEFGIQPVHQKETYLNTLN